MPIYNPLYPEEFYTDEFDKLTSLIKQYWRIKFHYPLTILLYKSKGFYSTFAEDAEKLSKILGLALTKRATGTETETDCVSFEEGLIDTYLPKLVIAGERVAIFEDLKDPNSAIQRLLKRKND